MGETKRRPGRKAARRGQFLVIAAVIIGTLVLGTALGIYQMGLDRQQFRYRSAKELVLGITSDFDRALGYALSNASKAFKGEWWDKDPPSDDPTAAIKSGEEFVSKWRRSAITSYSSLGLGMGIEKGNRTKKSVFALEWTDQGEGRSIADAMFSLDIAAYGLKGWEGRATRSLRLVIDNASIQIGEESTTWNFTLTKEWNEPVQGLEIRDLQVRIQPSIHGIFGSLNWFDVTVTGLSYLGDGRYEVTVGRRVNEWTKGISMVALTPDDEIYVGAAYRRELPEIQLQGRDAQGNPMYDDRGSIRLGWSSEWYDFRGAPVSITVPPDTYLLQWTTAYDQDYSFLEFVNWTGEGLAIKEQRVGDDAFYWLDVNGSGVVTVYYEPKGVVFRSQEVDGERPENLGAVGYKPIEATNFITHDLGGQVWVIPLPLGSYNITFDMPDPARSSFVNWTVKPESVLTVLSEEVDRRTATLTVLGNGTVTAFYNYTERGVPQTFSSWVIFRAEELNSRSPPEGVVEIWNDTFGSEATPGVTVDLSLARGDRTVWDLNGIYYLKYEDVSTRFSRWGAQPEPDSSLAVLPDDNPTTLEVSGNGTVTVYFEVNTQVTLLSVNLNDPTTGRPGAFRLKEVSSPDTAYFSVLPNDTIGMWPGDYNMTYIPDAPFTFERWGYESGVSIPVSELYYPTTVLTVADDGTVIAYYSKGNPGLYTIEFAELPESPGGGLFTFEDVVGSFRAGTRLTVGLDSRRYQVTYGPPEGRFVAWDVIPYSILSMTGDNTTGLLTVTSPPAGGYGKVIAYYEEGPYDNNEEGPYDNILFLSRELGSFTYGNLGEVLVTNATPGWSASVRPGQSVRLDAGEYVVNYAASTGFLFWNWTGLEGAAIGANDTNPTDLTVSDDGTVIVTYYLQPGLCKVIFQSQEVGSPSPTNGGWILLRNGSWSSGNFTLSAPEAQRTVVVSPGQYLLNYTADLGFRFEYWTSSPSGAVAFGSTTTKDTTFNVSANSVVIAWYSTKLFSVHFRSIEVNGNGGNEGLITLWNSSWYQTFSLSRDWALSRGDYNMSYEPKPGDRFINWTTDPYSANFKVSDQGNNASTTLTVKKDGTVTAYYKIPVRVHVHYDSKETSGLTSSRGSISFSPFSVNIPLPFDAYYVSTDLPLDIPLRYYAADGYIFVNWTAAPPENVTVSPQLESASIHIAGDGNVTVFYRPMYEVKLNSTYIRFIVDEDRPNNLGWITVDSQRLLRLPETIFLPPGGPIDASYACFNASYFFIGWQSSDGVAITGSSYNPTGLVISGNGTLTAFYTLAPEPAPPTTGWETLYVDHEQSGGGLVVPEEMRDPKLPPLPHIVWPYSQGQEHMTHYLESPRTPYEIVLSPIVNITLYLLPDPPHSTKKAIVELGFATSDGEYYKIDAVEMNAVTPLDFVNMPFDSRKGDYPGTLRVIPAGSTFILNLTAYFYTESGGGSYKLFYGYTWESRIDLFRRVWLNVSVYKETQPAAVEFQLDGKGPGGSSTDYYNTSTTSKPTSILVDPGNHTIWVLDSDMAGYTIEVWNCTGDAQVWQWWSNNTVTFCVGYEYQGGGNITAYYKQQAP